MLVLNDNFYKLQPGSVSSQDMVENCKNLCKELEIQLKGLGYRRFDSDGHVVTNPEKYSEVNFFDRHKFNTDKKYFNGNDRDQKGYDYYGFNSQGYDAKGFNKYGKDKDGYDIDGYNEDGRDRRGFDRNGFRENGQHINGTYFDNDGYNLQGFSVRGFNRDGINLNGTEYDNDGYNVRGFKQNGIHRNGTRFDEKGETFNGPPVFYTAEHDGDFLSSHTDNYGNIDYYVANYIPVHSYGDFSADDKEWSSEILKFKERDWNAVDAFSERLVKALKILTNQLRITGTVYLVPVPPSKEGATAPMSSCLERVSSELGVRFRDASDFFVRNESIPPAHRGAERTVERHLDTISFNGEISLNGRYIILDDVLTTGATMAACTQILENARTRMGQRIPSEHIYRFAFMKTR